VLAIDGDVMEVGDHCVRTAEGDQPGLEARPEDLDCEPERDGTHRYREDRRQAEREVCRPCRSAVPIVWPVHETTLHRHGGFEHSHPYAGPHRHWLRGWRRSLAVHDHAHEHGHSHGLVHDSIKRSGEGVRAVVLSLAVLAATALVQGVVFITSGSVALLADLIHNGGDALTALPLGVAFAMRSRRAEGYAGLAVVAAIFISALVAGAESIRRLIDPSPPTDLWVLACAGAIGYLGNWIAAQIRTRAGQRLSRPRCSLMATTRAPTRTYRSPLLPLPLPSPSACRSLIRSSACSSPWPSCASRGPRGSPSATTCAALRMTIATSPRAAHQDPRAARGQRHGHAPLSPRRD
jgi:hypothetical protein